jgi:hypothetical protein
MRSAIYYPYTSVRNASTIRAALLLWDELKVIVPWRDFRQQHKNPEFAAAWELVGGEMHPDRRQKLAAHERIKQMLGAEQAIKVYYGEDRPLGGAAHEVWPQKLLPETWKLLTEHHLTAGPLATGDYSLEEQVGLAIMAKLADACAGNTFARWTDRFLAYGLVVDRAPELAAQTSVIPLTLSLLDMSSIPIQSLIDFRRREKVERNGHDYTALRHRYADRIVRHIEETKDVCSENELEELRRQFADDMRRDLRELQEALRCNWIEAATSPVVVTAVVTAGSWLATRDPVATAAAALAGGGATGAIQRIAELFRYRQDFSVRQRRIMRDHPMAYLYALHERR